MAGFVDTLAGGGGLIAIPAFLLVGLTPAQALATNKCQAFAGTLTAASRLLTSGHIKIASLWPFALLAFVVALTGAWSLRAVSDADWLDWIVPMLLFAAALFFCLVRLPQTAMDHPPSFEVLAIMGIAFIGFYDSFFWSWHRIVNNIINDIDSRSRASGRNRPY